MLRGVILIVGNKLDDVFNLRGRCYVVTGATGLLGRKHAEAIACYGGTPILIDLSKRVIDKFVDELNLKYDTKSIGFVVDITDEQAIRDNVDMLMKKFGQIDGLVNNAANNPKVEQMGDVNFSRLENFPLKSWNQDVAVGLTGAFLCAKHYGYLISKNLDGGSIINISSDLGLIAPDQSLYYIDGLDDENQPVKPVTYSIIKSGLIGMTKYLATYFDGKVRANVLCPGGIQTNQDMKFVKKLSNLIPLKRMAKPNEYCGTIIYLLSDASSYMNGSVISVDGGRTVW